MTIQDNHSGFQPFEFRGTASEFFSIWFVNILFTLLTLGIYSAWAKVRTKRYLYGNTYLFGSSFDYIADPWKILKGRLVAAILFGLFVVSEYYSVVLHGILLVLLIIALPFLVVRAMRFNLANTVYRNIGFGFDAHYGRAALVFLGLPLFASLTLGLAYPYFVNEWKKFLIDHSRYGVTHFAMRNVTSDLYGVYFSALGVFILLIAAFGLVVWLAGSARTVIAPTLIFVAVLCMFVLYAYVTAQVKNLIFSNTRLDTHEFACRLETRNYAWLSIGNAIAIVFSFGLLTPWAIIRMRRYELSCMGVHAQEDVEAFVAAQQERPAAVGEELSDIFDIDFGL